jgi:hypothetical protein
VDSLDSLYAGGSLLELDVNGSYSGGEIFAANVMDARVGGALTLDSLEAGQLDLVVGDNANVESIVVGGAADVETGGALSGDTVEIGGNGTFSVGGTFQYNTVDIGGSADITAGGSLLVSGSFRSGANALLAIDGDTAITAIDAGGTFDLTGGGDFTFDQLVAVGADVSVGGNVAMGTVSLGGGSAVFSAGSISDNNSMINAGTVTLTAGGSIGAGGAIELNVARVLGISGGGDVSIVQNRAGSTPIGLLSAGGQLTIVVPNGGLVDGNADTLDNNGYNLVADGANVSAEWIGERTNPLEVKIGSGGLFVDSVSGKEYDTGYIWAHLDGTVNEKETGYQVRYDYPVPGLIIFNNQIVGGDEAILREVFRTEAFLVETPELKSKQGVFGSPYFLNSYLQISEPVAMGIVDYVLAGQAEITVTPAEAMPPGAKRSMGKGGIPGDVVPSYWQLPLSWAR